MSVLPLDSDKTVATLKMILVVLKVTLSILKESHACIVYIDSVPLAGL
jgi:hypothetical protein